MWILWESDSGQHVPTCDQTPPGPCVVMEMPDSLVHHVERFTSRLLGASTEWPRCSVDIEDSKYREICPTMDCASGVVDRVTAGGAFLYFNRHTAVQ